MFRVLLYCSVAYLVSGASTKAPWVQPSFCHNLACPVFTTLKQYATYQVRQYEQSMWISTSRSGVKPTDQAFEGMYKSLFTYFHGDNSAGKEIARTVPVLDEVDMLPDGLANITRSFMIPFFVQPNPPKPTQPEAYIRTYPAMKVFVKSFPGFDDEDVRAANIQQLKDAINDNSLYDNNKVFSAYYNGPFTFTGRHNEVWLIGV